MEQPLISIITPSYNRAGMIETAIMSVLNQNYPNLEHIIIDGGSTDGTLDLLNKYPRLKVVSEPDKGMYDALNKGLRLVTGEIIGFLNTDDFYATEIFPKIAQEFSRGDVDAVAGLAGLIPLGADPSQAISIYHPGQGSALIRHTILESPIFNAYFFSKSVFNKISLFDTRYRIAADRDFILRFALGNFHTIVVDFPVYYYVQHPGSMTFDDNIEKSSAMIDEHLKFLKTYLSARERYPKELLDSMVELSTRETIRACGHFIRQKDYNKAWQYFKEGLQNNPFWIFRFLRHAIVHPIRQAIGFPYQQP